MEKICQFSGTPTPQAMKCQTESCRTRWKATTSSRARVRRWRTRTEVSAHLCTVPTRRTRLTHRAVVSRTRPWTRVRPGPKPPSARKAVRRRTTRTSWTRWVHPGPFPRRPTQNSKPRHRLRTTLNKTSNSKCRSNNRCKFPNRVSNRWRRSRTNPDRCL